MRFSFMGGSMNSKRFIQFLKQLQGDTGQPIMVIVDNAKYHHSKETQSFIASQEKSGNGEMVMAF
jgi:transposase